MSFDRRELIHLLTFAAGSGNCRIVNFDPKVYPNGHFARIHDLKGNPIELWQPTG